MTAIGSYLDKIGGAIARGDATEHTHRPALKVLIEALASGGTATNEPRRVACGAPDFVISRNGLPIGYIEAKDVGKSLDEVEKSEQMGRYLESLNPLILTDYLEFRLYVDSQRVMRATLGAIGAKGQIKPDKTGADEFAKLISAFRDAKPPVIDNPRDLAARMAAKAHLIRDSITSALGDKDKGGGLRSQLESFQNILLRDMKEEQFADMYAQTICYGLFAARVHHPKGKDFTRQLAPGELPKTNPFLRKLFSHVAGVDLDERIAWAVDDLSELLNRADIGAILRDFGRRTRQEDPVVHFYETFLAEYDPKLRETRGVYYTPEPVVSYIVRSVDHILKSDFALKDGLADSSMIQLESPDGKKKENVHKALILDPATGTGTFLYGVINQIRQAFKQDKGMWPGYVKEHLLPRLFGFELLMAPYAVAHMKLGILLAESGYDFTADERLHVYLTNTLEEAFQLPKVDAFSSWLADESFEAKRIKQDYPVMVVLGNPPYSGHSANKGDWVENLMRGVEKGKKDSRTHNYFMVDGAPLGERNPKWLNDDYVKFIRFAQWRIERTGHGVLAFISNHGYLDNPTFRGMRQALMDTFDDIYILDLHGNSKKKEKAPDGGKDENVFDIQQGVAIGIFAKRPDVGGSGRGSSRTARCVVRHADLFGLREVFKDTPEGPLLTGGKYGWLYGHDVTTTKWTKLKPADPFYLFIPRDTKLLAEYESGLKVSEIFSPNGDPAPGIVTTHDEFAISWSQDEAIEKVNSLLNTASESEARSKFRLCSQNQWNYERAKNALKKGGWENEAKQILYRPFDMRWTIYNPHVAVHRRQRVMDHMLAGKNMGLSTTRYIEINRGWEHIFCANNIIQHHTVSLK